MPANGGHFYWESELFDGLKKMFGAKEPAHRPVREALEAGRPPSNRVAEMPTNSAFLCREAVFDRKNRLAGHIFRLQQSSFQANAKRHHQATYDLALLDTLNASEEAWNTILAFIPISSASLNVDAIELLKTKNIVLLIQLAEDADPATLCPRMQALRERGFSLGLFRQPRNAAYTDAILLADFGAIDVGSNDANTLRDYSAALRARENNHSVLMFGCNIDTVDDYRFCYQWHFDFFHGKFSVSNTRPATESSTDPHKVQLLHLMRLVQSDAETPEIVEAMKQDPLLTFRILRYLNSPALGLNHRIESLSQALIILGRQRLSRWLSVLLFSVREPNVGDWLLVESALTRGRLMEVLGAQSMPEKPHDLLFMAGIFSCIDRLLRRPMAEILDDIPLPEEIRVVLLDRTGPYAPLLDVAEACDAFDMTRMESTALAAGFQPHMVNRALLSATAWASEVTEHWE